MVLPVAGIGALGAAGGGGSILSALLPFAGPISSLLGGLGSKGSSRSSSSSTSSVNLAVNPSIAVVNGPGTANPSSSGYATGSPAASSSAAGNDQYLPSYLPTTGSYGPAKITQAPYDMIDARGRSGIVAAGLSSNPWLWLLAGGAALVFAMGKK